MYLFPCNPFDRFSQRVEEFDRDIRPRLKPIQREGDIPARQWFARLNGQESVLIQPGNSRAGNLRDDSKKGGN